MKKIICSLLVCALASQVFANGTAEKTADTRSNQPETVTIRLVHYMGEQAKRDALAKMIEVYQKDHPNVKVDIETVNSSSYLASYKNYIAAGDMPDILFGKPQNLTEFVKAGYFKDLANEDSMTDVLSILKDECTVDGGVYGFPIDAQVKGVFYNKKMFADAGVQVPTTKDAFFQVCDTFKAKGIHPLIHPYNFIHGVFHELDAFFTSEAAATGNGQVWMDSQSGKANLSDNRMMHEALEEFNKLVSYKDPGDTAVDQPQGIQNLAAGQRPMYINGGWLMGDVMAAAPDGDFGLFPMPWSNNPKENKLWVGIDDCFIVSASTKHPQEVHDLLASFASQESSEIWLDTAKLMSSNTKVSTENANGLIQAIKGYFDTNQIVSKSLVPDYTSEYSTAFRTQLQYFVTLDDSQRNVDTFLKEVDKEIASIRQ